MCSVQYLNLNVSTSVRNQAAKIVRILDLNTDVIFLAGKRLNSKYEQVVDSFRMKYNLYHNSTAACQGVAILVRNGIDYEALEEKRDSLENFLFLCI